MSSIFLLLQKVHDKVHALPMKINYSQPKFYTGGVDIDSWNTYSKADQKAALQKDWYVYFSFRNPKTKKLVRQQNIKGGVNTYKDKKTRHQILKILAKSLTILLDEGYDPYQTNLTPKQFLEQKEKKLDKKNTNISAKKTPTKKENFDFAAPIVTIKEAFDLGKSLKEKIMNANSYTKYKSRVTRFENWLTNQKVKNTESITIINKKLVIQYLNEVLQNSSPRNRNNTRTDLASFFQTLETMKS